MSDNVKKLLQQVITTAAGVASKEVETYTWKELRGYCQNLDLSFDADWMESVESELNAPRAFPARHCTRFEDHVSYTSGIVFLELTSNSNFSLP